MFKKKQQTPLFQIGDEVDVDPQYQREHPEYDCSGQAKIADVQIVFGVRIYGVSFPNMAPYFKFYWIGSSYLSLTQKENSDQSNN